MRTIKTAPNYCQYNLRDRWDRVTNAGYNPVFSYSYIDMNVFGVATKKATPIQILKNIKRNVKLCISSLLWTPTTVVYFNKNKKRIILEKEILENNQKGDLPHCRGMQPIADLLNSNPEIQKCDYVDYNTNKVIGKGKYEVDGFGAMRWVLVSGTTSTKKSKSVVIGICGIVALLFLTKFIKNRK